MFPGPPTPPDDARGWLAHIPPDRRGVGANWFHHAARTGATTPTALCSAVWQDVTRRLRSERDADRSAHLATVLDVLYTDQPGALAYAQSVINYEQLLYEERQKIKAERGRVFLTAAMAGKPTTAPQVAMLRCLGWAGAVPSDKAEASVLIDHLQQQTGGGQ
jgi:hypothetical protein